MIPQSCYTCDKPCLGNCHCYDARIEALNDNELVKNVLEFYCEPITGIGV